MNALAVIGAAAIATQTVRDYIKRRGAERQSDLAADILKVIYRCEPAFNHVRSIHELLATCEAGKPQLSGFEVENQKVEVYRRALNELQPAYDDIMDLLPSVRAVFGEHLANALSLIANTNVRLKAAVEQVSRYSIHGQNMLQRGIEFTGWDTPDFKLGPDQIAYAWKVLLNEPEDASEMRTQFASGKRALEKELLPIIRVGYQGR